VHIIENKKIKKKRKRKDERRKEIKSPWRANGMLVAL